MQSILEVAKDFLRSTVPPDGVVGDFTMGNGGDTLFLSRLVPMGKVYAFDVQPMALESTRRHLEEAGAGENVELILASHHLLEAYIPGEIDGGMFNLGYLPWSDKGVTTRRETTLPAIEAALEKLKVGGALVVVIYPGHEEGRLEGEAIQAFGAGLPQKRFDCTLHRILNVPDCPYILAFEKRR